MRWHASLCPRRGGLFSRAVAVVVAAALLLTTPSLSVYQVFAGDNAADSGATEGSGVTGVTVQNQPQFAAPQAGAVSAAGSAVPVRVTLPSLGIGGAQQGAVSLPSQTGAAPVALGSESAAPQAAAAPAAELTSEARGLPASNGLSSIANQESAPGFYRAAAGTPAERAQAREQLAPPAGTLNNAEAARSWSWNSFAAFFGLGSGSGRGAARAGSSGAADVYAGAGNGGRSAARASEAARAAPVENPVGRLAVPAPADNGVAESLAPAGSSWAATASKLLIGASLAVPALTLLLYGAPVLAASVPVAGAAHAAGLASLHTLGQIGYWTGNVLGFVFPFGSIYSLYRNQHAKNMSVAGPAAAFGASMLNGVVAMSVASPLWGIQNVFSGFGLLGIVLLARHYRENPGQAETPLPGALDSTARQVARSPAVRKTLGLGLALTIASVGLYWLGTVTLPGVMPALNAATHWLSFGRVGAFSRLAQLISTGVFLGMMIPDAVKLIRTKDAGSNSSMYYLTYLVACVGLGTWAGASWLEASDAAQKMTHLTNFANYVLSGIPAAIAYHLTRRFSKKAAEEKQAVTEKSQAFEAGVALRNVASQDLAAGPRIEAAASPGLREKDLAYLDKMDDKVWVLDFDFNDPAIARKLVEKDKAGVLQGVGLDRRQAFTPHSLAGWLIQNTTPGKVWTVSGMLAHPGAVQFPDAEATQSFVEGLQSQIREAGLETEAKDRLLAAFGASFESEAFAPEAVENGTPAPAGAHRGIMHIKLILGTDKQGNRYVVMGSANLTRAALGEAGEAANHEIQLFLTYPKDGPADAFDVFMSKFNEVKTQAEHSKQEPQPPLNQPAHAPQDAAAGEAAKPGELGAVSAPDNRSAAAAAFGHGPGSANGVFGAPERGPSPLKGDLVSSAKSGFISKILGFFHKPRAPEPSQTASASETVPETPNPFEAQVREDAFGVRRISGIVHSPVETGWAAPFKRLWARINIKDAAAAQDLIARTYGISHEQINALASNYRLPLNDRAAWVRLYDRLGALNRRGHDLLDDRKEDPAQRNEFSGFYKYVVKAWRAARPGEKNLIQSSGLFAYGLFDMFFLGYFRRAISYNLFHAQEDFLSIGQPGAPQRILDRLIREQAPLGTTDADRFRAGFAWRLFDLALWEPLLRPAFQFMYRRGTLAVCSTLAGGMIGGLMVLPFMQWSLVAHAAWLLPGVHTAATYVPFAAKAVGAVNGVASLIGLARAARSGNRQGMVAAGLGLLISAFLGFSGAALGPVFEKAADALFKSMAVGPLLQTFTLSWMLVFPSALTQVMAEKRRELGLDLDQRLGLWNAGDAALRMFFVPVYFVKTDAQGRDVAWYRRMGLTPYAKRLLWTFGGMVTVGAEIEGVMGYLGAWDGFFNPAWRAATGHNFALFETLGAAVERPATWTDAQGHVHKNLLPTGAINWGSSLLAQAEQWTGFDAATVGAGWSLALVNALHPTEQGTHILGLKGAERTRALEELRAQTRPLDPALQKLIDEKLKQAVSSGDISKEIARTKQRIGIIQSRLSEDRTALDRARRGAKPLPKNASQEYERLSKELALHRSRLQILDKLAQKGDLLGAGKDARALKDLDAEDQKVLALLAGQNDAGGYRESLQTDAASLASLQDMVKGMSAKNWNKPQSAPGTGAAKAADAVRFSEIQRILDGGVDPVSGQLQPGLFTLQDKIRSEISARDSQAKELSALNAARMKALDQRRNGDDFMNFIKKQSGLSMTMYLKAEVAEANAAIAQLNSMEAMLQTNINNYNAQGNANNQTSATAQSNLNQVPAWNQQVTNQVNQDNSYLGTMKQLNWETSTVGADIASVQNTYNGLLNVINQRDRDQNASGAYLSPNAPAEYQRILGLLQSGAPANIAQNGDPSNPNSLSVAFVNNYINQIQGFLTQAQSGVSQIENAPQELAGLMIILVPGTPAFSGSNPTNAEVISYIAQRQTYWQGQQTSYQSLLNSINAQLDPNNTTLENNALGIAQPVSAVRYLSQEQAAQAQDQALVNSLTAAIDAKAADIQTQVGVSLPRLSGLGYTALGNALLSYQNALQQIPSGTTQQAYQAQFDELQIVGMLGPLADATIQWAYAQNAVPQIQAGINVLTQASQAIGLAVSLTQAIIADGQADLTFMNTPLPTNPTQLANVRQQLINRKLALVQNTIIPDLTSIQTFMTQTLLPYEQGSAASYSATPNGSNLAYFYSEKQTIYNTISGIINQTFPLAIAQSGANLKNQLSAYTGPNGTITQEQTLINQYLGTAPYPGTYSFYGITMPFALPARVTYLTQQENSLMSSMTSQAKQIDVITAQINKLTNNQYNIQPLSPQVSNPANLVNTITPFGQTLQQIANAAKAGGTSATVSSTGQIQANTNAQLADLSLDALNILLLNPGANFAANVANWTLDNAVITAAQQALAPGGQIPQAQAFLSQANTAINGALATAAQAASYVGTYQSNPPPLPGPPSTSGPGQTLLTQQTAMYNQLAGFTQNGTTFFQNEANSDSGGYSTVNQLQTFWQAQQNIGSYGTQVAAGDVSEMQSILQSVQQELATIQAEEQEAMGWLAQLNPQGDPATQQVIEAIQQMQGDTEKVLESKVKYDRSNEKLQWDDKELDDSLGQYRDQQKKLADAVRALPPGTTLDPATLARVQKALGFSGGWLLDSSGADQTQAIVVSKTDWPAFVQKLLTAVSPSVDVSATLQNVINNPASLSELLPGTKMLNMGDDANGFYLVYSSYFGTPGGIETSSMVKLGNVANLWGQNVSVTGYHFASPPNSVNAPYGDQGLALDIESLQGKNWVNYLDVVLHRDIQDVPTDTSTGAQLADTRMLVYEDYAVLVANDTLYIGAAGYGDWSLEGAASNPYYYGGNVKTSIQFTPVLKLNAQQSDLWAQDPQAFLETINLDFTGLNPALNQNYNIATQAFDAEYHRTQVGPTIDVGKLMKSQDTFTVDVYLANTWGTDGVTQQSVGTTVVKGFSFPLFGQKAQVTNSAGAELGTVYNSYTDKVNLMLPNSKITLTGQGQLTAGQTAFYGGVERDSADGHNKLSVGYGAPYLGEDNRLRITTTSAYTLAQIFGTAVDAAKDQAKGGSVLKDFNDSLDSAVGANTPEMKELKAVFASDAAKMLDSQQIGQLNAQLQQLQKAGAILDNTKVQAVAGFVSGPPGTDTTDLATGGGFQVGVLTDYSMTKSQKEQMDLDVAQIGVTSLQLKARLRELAQNWRELVLQVYDAQWQERMAQYLLNNVSDPVTQQEARVRLAKAQAEENQAKVRYNELTGRDPNTPLPFANLGQKQVYELLAEVQKMAAAPDALSTVLAKLEPDQLPMTKQGFNLMDYVPWIEKLDLTWGSQLQDMEANQLMGFGLGVTVPIYDASGKTKEAYKLQSKAAQEEMAQAWRDEEMHEDEQRAASRAAVDKAESLSAGQDEAAQDLRLAIAGERNGTMPASALWDAADRWTRYTEDLLQARAQGAVDNNDALLTAASQPNKYQTGKDRVHLLTSLDDAWQQATVAGNELDALREARDLLSNSPGAKDLKEASDALSRTGKFQDIAGPLGKASASPDASARQAAAKAALDALAQRIALYEQEVPAHDFAELALRAQAADQLRQAEAKRIQKVSATFTLGTNVTDSGTAFLPVFGITDVSFLPTFDFNFTSAELAALNDQEGEARYHFYQTTRSKAEAAAAVELYENYLTIWYGEKEARILHDQILPGLRQKAAGGDAEAREALDRGQVRLQAVQEQVAQSRRLINYLLDQPLDTALTVSMTPDDAQAWIEGVIAKEKPAGLEQDLLDTEVKLAQAIETVVDKNMKAQDVQLGFGPVVAVSLVVRSVTELVNALVSDPTASQDLVQQARAQTLAAQQAEDSYIKSVPADAARVREALAKVEADLAAARGKDDPQDQLLALELEQQRRVLQARLDSLQNGPALEPSAVPAAAASPASSGGLPRSFQDLQSRLEAAQVGLDQSATPALPQDITLDSMREYVQAYDRQTYYNEDLGEDPINKWYNESWIVAELKDPTIDKDKLAQLAQVMREKSDADNQTALAKAHAEASSLSAEFQMLTERYRAAQKAGDPSVAGLSAQDLSDYQKALRDRLDELRVEIAARLGLDPSRTSLDALMALVPEGDAASDTAFAERMGVIRTDAVGQILFDGALPKSSEQDIRISNIQADMTAQQMSYKGFTPVFVDGTFRGNNIWMGAIEAPNPQEIQDKLTDVLGDALRRDIQSRQQQKDLAARLYSLMHSVDDDRALVQNLSGLVRGSQDALQAGNAQRLSGMERFKVEENLVQAQSQLTDAMVKLHTDFVTLVTELEAMGLKDKAGLTDQKPQAPPALLMPDLQRFSVEPAQERFLDYASARFADADYAAAALQALSGVSDPKYQKLVSDLSDKAAVYRRAAADARTVRAADIPSSERMKFLTQIDEEGRRQAVGDALKGVLDALAARPDGDKIWDAYFGQTRGDLESQETLAAGTLAANDRTLEAVRQAYWHGRVGLPLDLEGSFQRVESLWLAKEQLRQQLFQEYLGSTDSPLQFQLQNLALDKFLKAQDAFDTELLALLKDPRVSGGEGRAGDKDLARMLDSLFDYRVSAARQRDKFAYGRAALAMDTLASLAQSQLDGLKFSGASPERVEEAAQRLDQIQQMKQHWISDPSDLQTVYAEVAVDAAGNPTWDARGWLTADDYAALKGSQIVSTPDGREWYLPRPTKTPPKDAAEAAALGALEVLRGLDVRRAAAQERAQARDANAREIALARTLQTSPFALVGDDVQPLSKDQLDQLQAKDRLFYFRSQPDDQGEHDWTHPWIARNDPQGYDILVYTGDPAVEAQLGALKGAAAVIADALKTPGDDGRMAAARQAAQAVSGVPGLEPVSDELSKAPSRDPNGLAAALRVVLSDVNGRLKSLEEEDHVGQDRFPTRESIARSGLSDRFKTLRIGDEGYKALSDEANFQAQTAERAGYIALKLTTYGFALNKDGKIEGPEDLFVTEEEMNKAREEIRDAPSLIEKQHKELKDAEGDLADAQKTLYGEAVSGEDALAQAQLALALDQRKGDKDLVKKDADAVKTATAARDASLKRLSNSATGGKNAALRKADLKSQLIHETQDQKKEGEKRSSFAPAADKPQTPTLDEAIAQLQKTIADLQGRLANGGDNLQVRKSLQDLLQQQRDAVAFKEKAKGLSEKKLDILAQDAGDDYKKAKEDFDAANKDASDAQDRVTAAVKEIARLERVRVEGATERFFKSDDMVWQVSPSGELTGVRAPALVGAPLSVDLGSEKAVQEKGGREIGGHVEAVELSHDPQRLNDLVRVYTSKADMDKDSARWTLLDVGGRPAERGSGGGTQTLFRAWEYVDPANGNPIYLNRDYLLKRLDSAEGGLSYAKHYAYWPITNIPSLLLQIPRGIAAVPEEIAFGVDSNQNNYLGEVYMYKTEGGATERHGALMSLAHFVDVLNFIPDPVTRYMDPSQFPQFVLLSGPVKPGEDLTEKSPRTADQNIHFGEGAMSKRVGYAQEQLQADRDAALLDFAGGSQTTDVAVVRGRQGAYEDSKVATDVSPNAVMTAANAAGAAQMDKSGLRAEVAANPGHVEVENVQQDIQVWPGEQGYAKQAGDYDQAALKAVQHFEDVAKQAPALDKDAAAADAALKQADAERLKARAEERALDAETRKWAVLIGEHDAREKAIIDLTTRVAQAKRDLLFEEAYLKALEDALKKHGQPPIVPKPGEGHPALDSAWKTMIEVASFGVIGFALWSHWRGRKNKPAAVWSRLLRRIRDFRLLRKRGGN